MPPYRIVRLRSILMIGLAALAHAISAAALAQSFTDGDTVLAGLLTSIDQRLGLMGQVAAVKWRAHLPVRDAAREAAVLHQARAEAHALGLSPSAVENLFALQLQRARDSQQRLFDDWTREGFSETVADAVSLSHDLRPKLDAMTREQLRALYIWVATDQALSGANRVDASLVRALPAARWSGAQRAELIEAIDAVHITSEGSLRRARHAGILRIATTGDYAPFTEERAGTLSGVDVDLALGLAAELRLNPQFVRTTWRGLVGDLKAGRFDVAVGGISVTRERAALGDFSPALFNGGKTAIGRCADASRFTSIESIDHAGVRVIYNRGGTNEAFVRGAIRRAEVRGMIDNRLTFEEVREGRADVMFTDDTEVEWQHRRHPELCRLLRETYMPASKAFWMPRDRDLRRAVAGWADRQIAAREPDRLLTRYMSDLER